jgi:hypothetical protein
VTKRERSIVQRVPPSTPFEQNLSERTIAIAPCYEVAGWREGPARSDIPETEVHLILPVAHGIDVALRLKSSRAVDELVGVLLEHRRRVFGGSE